MFTAQAEGFEEPLAKGRDGNTKFPHAVRHDGIGHRRVRWRLVLDDLQGAYPRALDTPPGQVQAAIAVGPEQNGARAGQVCLGIQVAGNPDGVRQDRPVDVVIRIDIDATHELDELPCPRQVVTAGLVDRLADQPEGHYLTFTCFRYAKVSL